MKLLHKLLIVNVGIILTLVAVLQAVSYFSSKSFMNDVIVRVDSQKLTQLATRLSDYYQKHQKWDSLTESHVNWQQIVESSLQDNVFHENRPRRARPDFSDKPSMGLFENNTNLIRKSVQFGRENPPFMKDLGFLSDTFVDRLSLLDSQENVVIKSTYNSNQLLSQQIVLNQKVIGWLAIREINDDHSPSTGRHMQMRLLFSLGIAAIGIVISVIFSFFLSRHITAPIYQLNRAAAELAKRNFKTYISVNTKDELNELACSFNSISKALLDYETSQKQWLIDISHELRTPLTILNGEIQGIKDGVISCNAESILSLQEEVNLLVRLVEDLHELSLTEATEFKCKKEEVDLKQLLANQLKKYKNKFSERNIAIEQETPLGEFYVVGDHDRLAQVINNILENNYRYTESSGQLWVGLKAQKNRVCIQIEDSGPGVHENVLNKLFDRLYRADPSRNRKSGGAGIGLTICQNIVDAHGGTISAYKGQYGGLSVVIVLPSKFID